MAKNREGFEKSQEETQLEEKVLYVNRCAKVVKGGRKFSFSALILVGDGKGRVGYGFAKANELTDAIKKGGEAARRGIITFDTERTTIPHEVDVSWDGARVMLKPTPKGSGVVAGSQVRAILEMAGIKDVMAKSLGGNNPINQVRAVFLALQKLCARDKIKKRRGIA